MAGNLSNSVKDLNFEMQESRNPKQGKFKEIHNTIHHNTTSEKQTQEKKFFESTQRETSQKKTKLNDSRFLI